MKHSPAAPADQKHGAQKFLGFLYRSARRAIERCGVPEQDRDDVVQEVVSAAFLAWPTYREDGGTPAQWLWGIVRRQYRAYLRRRERLPIAVGDDVLDVPDEAPLVEVGMWQDERLDALWTCLPVRQQRVVWLRQVVGLTLVEIAACEGLSKSEAHRRHAAGMATLKAAVERRQDQKLAGVAPFSLAALFNPDLGPEPPPGEVARAWERMAAQLGLDDAPASEPPRSGERRSVSRPGESCAATSPSDPPPRGRSLLLRLLGPFGSALLGGLVTAVALHRCNEDPAREELARAVRVQAVTIAATPAAAGAGSGAAVGQAPDAATTVATAPADPETAPHTGRPYRDRFDPERALLQRGREALHDGNLSRALEAWAEHAQRYPRGPSTDEREQLWTAACARYRRALAPGGVLDARCNGR